MFEDLQRFVVRMPNWLGDAVMATAALHDLKAHFPNSSITVAASHPIQELLLHDTAVDERIAFSRKASEKSKEKKRFTKLLQEKMYMAAILMTGSFSSAWQFFMARKSFQKRIGFASHFRSLLLTDPIEEPPKGVHLVDCYKRLLQPLGIPISSTEPKLFVADYEKSEALDLLASHSISPRDRLIGINPGAAYGSAKCWPEESFRELTEKLLQNPAYKIVYFGDPGTKPVVDFITAGFPDRVVNLAAKTSLRQLIALIGCCSFFITNDSGPMHIAAALKRPLIALFGSTNEIKTGPYASMQHVIHKHVPCSPCYLRKCPIDFRCMRSITVDDVLREVSRL
jgi:heptosyltransferase-2